MTFNNENWTTLWEKYSVSLNFINQTAKGIHEVCETFRRLADFIREVFSKLSEKLKDIFNLLKESAQEEISCNNYMCPRRQYDYKPQLKVNTKGYTRCCSLPVTRRYI